MKLTEYMKSEWIGMRVYVMSQRRGMQHLTQFAGTILDYSDNRHGSKDPRVLIKPESDSMWAQPKWCSPSQVEVLEA